MTLLCHTLYQFEISWSDSASFDVYFCHKRNLLRKAASSQHHCWHMLLKYMVIYEDYSWQNWTSSMAWISFQFFVQICCPPFKKCHHGMAIFFSKDVLTLQYTFSLDLYSNSLPKMIHKGRKMDGGGVLTTGSKHYNLMVMS